MNKLAPLFLIILIVSMWQFPAVAPALSIAFLLFSLAAAIALIFKKHKASENPRPKIVKEVLILIITLLLIIFLGGLAGMFANYYAGLHFGVIAGFIAAIAASFGVGFLVKQGITKIFSKIM